MKILDFINLFSQSIYNFLIWNIIQILDSSKIMISFKKVYMLEYLLEKKKNYETFQEAYDEELCGLVKEYLSMDFSFNDLSSLIEKIYSKDIKDNHFGVIGLSKLFLMENNETVIKKETLIDKAIDLLPKLIEFMGETDFPQLQIEAVCIMKQILHKAPEGYDQEEVLCLLKLLSSKYPEIVKQVKLILLEVKNPKLGTSLTQSNVKQ